MIRRLLPVIAAVGLIGCESAPNVAALLQQNKPFNFDFELTDVDGNKVSKADLMGHVAIVDIWGTWCPPCRAEIPHFVALDKQYRDKGLRIVGLNDEKTQDSDAATHRVRAFREQHGIKYPCALITDEVEDQVPQFEGFPTTLFFDRTGTVRLKLVGAEDYSTLRAVVEHLLNEKEK
jgi:thiol-disulfide isomerase/thioredoxin